MPRRMPLAEVRAHIAATVDQVLHRGERVVIERHGRAVAAIVTIDDLARIEGLQPSPITAHLAGALAIVGVWAGAADAEIDGFLADVAASRRRDTGRRISLKP